MPDTGTIQGPIADVVELPLVWDLTAPALARQLVRVTLDRWGLPELVESAVMVVSELTTNAVVHGAPPMHVSMCREPHQIRISVYDAGHAVAAAATVPVHDHEEHGRGLVIVRQLSADSGVDPVQGDGTVAFATFLRPVG
jgi:anti-sigma regulatory factor (Ser/Thr protein kinase)